MVSGLLAALSQAHATTPPDIGMGNDVRDGRCQCIRRQVYGRQDNQRRLP